MHGNLEVEVEVKVEVKVKVKVKVKVEVIELRSYGVMELLGCKGAGLLSL